MWPEALSRLFGDALSAIRFADVVDICVVSTFAYTAITWVRRARSRFVMLGFATLVAIYFVARLLDMYLTLFLFQAGVTVALVALVVIFQEEIRRAFERIATNPLLRGARPVRSKVLDSIEALVQAVVSLAATRTGALIVLSGKEPLERHTVGGIVLDGRVSAPLLCSIFDPSSPGHDGAVLIEQGIVSKFGAHLPLSERASEATPLGTRHTAALGLSERSDALVLVVSEERGTISIANAGTLSEVRDSDELRNRLMQFSSEVTPREISRTWGRLFAHNLGTKLLSVAIAVLAWTLVFGQQSRTVARTFNVPIIFRDVPDGWLLDDPEPLEARVTISGKSRALETLNAATIRLSVDATAIKAGRQVVHLAPSQLGLPDGFTVHEIAPDSASFTAHRTSPHELPVQAALIGRPPADLVVREVRVEPSRIRVMVDSSERGALMALQTEPINLADLRGDLTLTRGVILPRGSRLARGEPNSVQVTLTVEAAPH